MTSRPEVPAVEVHTEIAARPATVWSFIADPVRLGRVLDARVSMTPRVGAPVEIVFEPHGVVVAGEVLEVVPGERPVLSWGVASGPQRETMPAGSTRVTIRLAAAGEGTVVRVTHDGLPSEAERRDHAGGWGEYLEILSRLAAGEDHPPPRAPAGPPV